MPPVIAHRGASHLAPENTLSAFRMAYECGAKWVEFDVMLAACGEPIVFHDATLERITFESGKVINYPYAHLKQLDAGSWFDPIFRHEKIPRLVEVLDLLQHYQLGANIEIKPVKGREIETVKIVFETVMAAQKQSSIPLFFSSFSISALRALRNLSESVPLALVVDHFSKGWERVFNELNCMSLNVREDLLTEETIKTLRMTLQLNEPTILAWTINNPLNAIRLFEWGIDAVFTDVPDVILQHLSL